MGNTVKELPKEQSILYHINQINKSVIALNDIFEDTRIQSPVESDYFNKVWCYEDGEIHWGYREHFEEFHEFEYSESAERYSTKEGLCMFLINDCMGQEYYALFNEKDKVNYPEEY